MSLIYDYLKINGKIDPERDSEVEIFPTLKRSDSERHKRRTVLIILGSCLVGALFLFSAVKIFTPEEDVQVAVDSVSMPTMQARPDPAPLITEAKVAVPQMEQPAPVPAVEASSPAVEVSSPAVDSPAPEQANIPGENVIQVFPEMEKPAIAEADIVQETADAVTWQAGTIKKKHPQTLELENKTKKITFLEESPDYTEVKQPVEKITQDFSFYGDAAVPGPDSTALHKSKKFYQAGVHAQQSGDQRDAEIYYNKALEELPLHLEAMINLSALYVQQQRYEEAEIILADILEIDPANSKALVNLGVINLNKYNEPLAEEQFLAALDANPLEENALVNLAYLAEKRQDFVTTERYYRYLLQISPDNIEVLLSYGYLLEVENRHPEAVALYRDCLKLDNVQKDIQLYEKITQRMRLLAGKR